MPLLDRAETVIGPDPLREREVHMIGMLKMTTETAQMIAGYVSSRMNLSDRGATAVEYGMIVALIAAVIITVVTTLGTDVSTGFQTIEDGL
jgi:pilus assembly protein Flp/PilA